MNKFHKKLFFNNLLLFYGKKLTSKWRDPVFSNGFLNWIEMFYRCVTWIGNNLQSLFLLLLRLTWGTQFWITGIGKLMNPDKASRFFESLHIPAPYFSTIVVGLFEVIGVAFLILGFSSRLICIPLAVILFGAYVTAHVNAFDHFAFITNPALLVKEAPFPFLMTVLIVFVFGPGKASIDAWIKNRLEKKRRT